MITVIVPVYNTEKYLGKCVESILAQTYTEFELILVDDGSTDNSGKMCDSFAAKDKRVKAIHIRNSGPSEARNKAALMAEGEYISFIDSDDFVTADYLITLHEALVKTNADISAVLMSELQEDEEPKEDRKSKNRSVTLSGRDALLNVLYQKDLDTTPCGMLYKKEIVLANPFPKGRYHEDDFTMFRYFEMAETVTIVKCIKYFYVQHETSIMHRKTINILKDEIDASDHLENYFSTKDHELHKAAKSKKFSNYCQLIIENPDFPDTGRDDYEKVSAYLKKNRLSIVFNPHTRTKNKIAGIILCFGIRALTAAADVIGH